MVLGFLLAGGGGLESFVHASPELTDPDVAPIDLTEPGEGFDGQFYFRLAADPLSAEDRVEGIAFDLPAVRAARVGYPAIAGALAFGQVGAIPATLVVVNVAAAGVVAGAGASLARTARRSGWWGLTVLAFPGFVYTVGFDLAELVEAAAVLAAVVALRQGRTATAAGALVLAVLTKETALALPLGIVAVSALSLVPWLPAAARRTLWPGRPAVVSGVTALAVAAAWQGAVWVQWEEVPLAGSADKNIRLPFAGLVSARDAFTPTSGEALFRLGSLAVVVVAVGAAVVVMQSGRGSGSGRVAVDPPAPHEPGALVVAVLVATLMSEFVWAGATSFMRGLTEVWLFSVTILLTRPRPRPAVGALVAVAGVGGTAVTVAAEVVKRA